MRCVHILAVDEIGIAAIIQLKVINADTQNVIRLLQYNKPRDF